MLGGSNVDANAEIVAYGKIYATWCGACTAFAPMWNKVVARVNKENGEGKEMSIEESDLAIKRGEFTEKFGTPLPEIDGYPTVYRLKKGAAVELYTGPRTEEDLVRWLS